MHDMTEELRNCRLDQPHVRLLARSLAELPEELDPLIERLIAAGDEGALTPLLVAMAVAGRRIDARHLPAAAPLLIGLDHLAIAALHAEGEVVDALLEAVRQNQCGWEREALLLLLAAWICRHRAPEHPLPEDLTPLARKLAREARVGMLMAVPLFALAIVVEDAGLRALLESRRRPPPEALTSRLIRDLCELPARDPLAALPERADYVLHEGGTLRRSVSKIGRNDPCPCGSGRKYKKCCYQKDQERLRRSSVVAGVTTDEIEANPEPFLTEERVLSLRSHHLARLRMEQVPHRLQGLVLRRLAMFGRTDVLMTAWETVGWRADLEDAWEACILELVPERRHDDVARLVALRGIEPDDEVIPLEARMLMLEGQPAEYLRLAEAVALGSVMDPDNRDHVDLAYALLEGAYPGLGTLIARGAATTGKPMEVMLLLYAIGTVRDRFNLSPEDPAAEVLESALELPDAASEREREQLEATRNAMELATAEASRLKKELEETRVRLEREERRAAGASAEAERRTAAVPPEPAPARTAPATPASPAPPADPGQDVAALQRRVAELKSALSERHVERNVLRRELSRAMSETEALRRRAAAPAESADDREAAAEEAALMREETATTVQPPRLPVFPARFRDILESFPDSIQRAALRLIGRLAAGEASAFAGVRRLRSNRDISRARVGADHRLFFRLQPGRLEILDLINRRDFDRWLKSRG